MSGPLCGLGIDMYICMYVYMYIYIYTYTHIYIYILYTYTHMCICMRVFVYIKDLYIQGSAEFVVLDLDDSSCLEQAMRDAVNMCA